MNIKFFSIVLILTIGCGGSSEDSEVSSDFQGMKKCGTVNSPIRIMPLGDSITEAEKPQNSYRRSLWFNLKNAGCEIDFVGSKKGVRNRTAPLQDFDSDHEGYWGYRVDQILPFIKARTTQYKPDIALIHLGSNDVFNGQSFEGTIEELKILINEIRTVQPEVTIFIAKIIPSRRFVAEISDFNIKLEAAFKSFNTPTSKLILVDQNVDYLLDYNYDGTHPNSTGEQRIADKWANAIIAEYDL
jgi:lysophospholipase L1-like esterase